VRKISHEIYYEHSNTKMVIQMTNEKLSRTEIEELLTQYCVEKETVVEILLNQSRFYPTEETTTYRLCKDFLTLGSNALKEYIWGVLVDNDFLQTIVEQMQPIRERNWIREFYTRSKNPVLSDVDYEDCFYVESQFEGQYGTQFWINFNNTDSHLTALPSRKALTQKLEAGKFYRCTKHECNEGRGYTYHDYEFEEITEEEYFRSISKVMSRDIYNQMYRNYD